MNVTANAINADQAFKELGQITRTLHEAKSEP
jgi:hypothetical protein